MLTPEVVAIGHVCLRTPDVPRLAAFYRDVVGLKLVVASQHFNAFEVGDVHFCIIAGAPRPAGFDFTTNDVEGYRQRLRAAGVACSGITVGAWSGHHGFDFTDPDGNVMTVTNAHLEMPAVVGGSAS